MAEGERVTHLDHRGLGAKLLDALPRPLRRLLGGHDTLPLTIVPNDGSRRFIGPQHPPSDDPPPPAAA